MFLSVFAATKVLADSQDLLSKVGTNWVLCSTPFQNSSFETFGEA